MRHIQLGDVQGDKTIAVGEAERARDQVTIDLGAVEDFSINSQTPIRRIEVAEWEDAGGEQDTIVAPSVKEIKVLGDKKTGTSGDFGADVILTGTEKGRALDRVQVAGRISGGTWNVTGDIGTITTDGADEDWVLEVDGEIGRISSSEGLSGTIIATSIRSIDTRGPLTANIIVTGTNNRGVSIGRLRATSVGDVSVTTTGGIESIQVTEWEDGEITAPWLKSLKVTGNRREAIAGDFGADVNLTELTTRNKLRQMSVAGWLRDAQIRTRSDVGSLQVGGMENSRVYVGVQEEVGDAPSSLDDFETTGTIGRLRLGSTREGISLLDSVIAADGATGGLGRRPGHLTAGVVDFDHHGPAASLQPPDADGSGAAIEHRYTRHGGCG